MYICRYIHYCIIYLLFIINICMFLFIIHITTNDTVFYAELLQDRNVFHIALVEMTVSEQCYIFIWGKA